MSAARASLRIDAPFVSPSRTGELNVQKRLKSPSKIGQEMGKQVISPARIGEINGQYLWAPNGTRLTARTISRGPQISRVPGPYPPRKELACMKTIMHGAVRFTDA